MTSSNERDRLTKIYHRYNAICKSVKTSPEKVHISTTWKVLTNTYSLVMVKMFQNLFFFCYFWRLLRLQLNWRTFWKNCKQFTILATKHLKMIKKTKTMLPKIEPKNCSLPKVMIVVNSQPLLQHVLSLGWTSSVKTVTSILSKYSSSFTFIFLSFVPKTLFSCEWHYLFMYLSVHQEIVVTTTLAEMWINHCKTMNQPVLQYEDTFVKVIFRVVARITDLWLKTPQHQSLEILIKLLDLIQRGWRHFTEYIQESPELLLNQTSKHLASTLALAKCLILVSVLLDLSWLKISVLPVSFFIYNILFRWENMRRLKNSIVSQFHLFNKISLRRAMDMN